MTQPLTIPTPFNDVAELTDNFATRVDETQIMLPHDQPVEEGTWVQFSVLLADGSLALEGTGRSAGSHDNGEEYPPEYRFDVVLDSLQLDGMSEVMFERFLQARQSQLEGDPGTGEVDVNQLEAAPPEPEEEAAAEPPADLPTEAVALEPSAPMEALSELPEEEPADAAGAEEEQPYAAEEAPAEEEAFAAPTEEPYAEDAAPAEAEDWAPEDGGFVEQVPTQAVHLDEVQPVRSERPAPPVASAPPPVRSAPPPAARPARPAPPQRPRGVLPAMHTFDHGILTRPSSSAGWEPEIIPRPEPAQSSGLFDYQGGLPRPAAPPHPEMAEEQRVAPAPSPSAPWSAPTSA